MTLAAMPGPLVVLVDRLSAEHADTVTRGEVSGCVASAWEAVQYFGATDDAEMIGLAERIAERELLLRLGLERDVARLDPEDHHRPVG